MTYQKFSERQKSPARRFLFILGLVMFALYFFIGVSIIFWEDFPLLYGVESAWKIAFGLLLIVYSFFRFVRLINRDKND